MIAFVGGPYHGDSGLYDHDHYDTIAFSDRHEKVTHVYKRMDAFRYYYHEAQHWGRLSKQHAGDQT